VHIWSAQKQSQKSKKMKIWKIADTQQDEAPDEQQREGEGDIVEDTIMDVVPALDVQQHASRKMKNEKVVRVPPRLYQHVLAQLLEPPISFHLGKYLTPDDLSPDETVYDLLVHEELAQGQSNR
jgi:hypothetical protein